MGVFESLSGPSRSIGSVNVRSGGRCGPSIWHMRPPLGLKQVYVSHNHRMRRSHRPLSRLLLFMWSQSVSLGFRFLSFEFEFKRSADLPLAT